jgi:hypothetical protein
MKEKPPVSELEQEVRAFLREHYPTKRSWIKKDLELFNGWRDREVEPKSNFKVVSEAIDLIWEGARNRGINIDKEEETDILNIPSYVAAIEKFEKESGEVIKQLYLSDIVELFAVAESASIQKTIHQGNPERVFAHLDNLKRLIRFHARLKKERL